MLLGASRSLRLSMIARSPVLRVSSVKSARLAATVRRNASPIVASSSSSPTTIDDVSTSSSSSDPNTNNSSNRPPPPQQQPTKNWKLKLLHDSDCPLCEREVRMLKRRDAERQNAILFVDVADPNYDPAQHNGIDYETAMRTIHGVVRDDEDENSEQTVLTGVDVFRRAYDLVGLGFVYAFLDVPVLKSAATVLYDAWARIRLPLTGRPALEVVLAEKKTCRDAGGKESE